MCLTVITIIVIYFYYPETKKRSLEEVASYFDETVVTDATYDKSGRGNGARPSEKDGDNVGHAEQMS